MQICNKVNEKGYSLIKNVAFILSSDTDYISLYRQLKSIGKMVIVVAVKGQSIGQKAKNQKLKSIDSKKIQAAVNLECRTVSEKTIHNAFGFVKSVMKEYAPNVQINVKLPQKKKYEAQFPPIR